MKQCNKKGETNPKFPLTKVAIMARIIQGDTYKNCAEQRGDSHTRKNTGIYQASQIQGTQDKFEEILEDV